MDHRGPNPSPHPLKMMGSRRRIDSTVISRLLVLFVLLVRMHLADNTFNVAQDMAFDLFVKTLYVTLQDPVALNTALTAVDIASRQTERKLILNGLSKGVVMNYYGPHLYVAVDAILAQ